MPIRQTISRATVPAPDSAHLVCLTARELDPRNMGRRLAGAEGPGRLITRDEFERLVNIVVAQYHAMPLPIPGHAHERFLAHFKTTIADLGIDGVEP